MSIRRECWRPNSTCILSIDTTLNIGNFYVTTTMYQSKKVISKEEEKSPRDVSQYRDRIDVKAPIESDSPYEIVFIAQMKDNTC